MTPEEAKALREPFPREVIGYLPKAGKQFAFVGHAAVTDRLLQVDPEWTWEPVAFDAAGSPLWTAGGNDAVMWIKLTVCGTTRYGVGMVATNAFDLEKQLVSDALKNAAMRFGVALDMWDEDLQAMHEEEPRGELGRAHGPAQGEAVSSTTTASPELPKAIPEKYATLTAEDIDKMNGGGISGLLLALGATDASGTLDSLKARAKRELGV